MQTGQNSIAPENSLPQTEQTRLSTAFMDRTAPQIGHELPKWSWCESSAAAYAGGPSSLSRRSGSLSNDSGKSLFRNKFLQPLKPDRPRSARARQQP